MQDQAYIKFISDHQLPESYIEQALRCFSPLAKSIADAQKKAKRTLLLGINGSQGSGKSTLADFLALLLRKNDGLNVVVLSIDDFYFTLQQRQSLAKRIHPLLITRGVPGTHDIELAIDVIQQLKDGTCPTLVPRFNKAIDDRYPEEEWQTITTKTDIIILEGWCLGAEPQAEDELFEPVNELEKVEDPDSRWRSYVNQQLQDVYPQLFNLVDRWVMLKAPSFDCVYQWRLEQENKLRSSELNSQHETANSADRIMDSKQIARFIQHYQRITEGLLETLPARVDYLFKLDKNRKIISDRTD